MTLVDLNTTVMETLVHHNETDTLNGSIHGGPATHMVVANCPECTGLRCARYVAYARTQDALGRYGRCDKCGYIGPAQYIPLSGLT